MRFLLLSLFVLVSCSKKASYDPRKLTSVVAPNPINAPVSGYTNNINKTISGGLPPGLTVSVHTANDCGDVALASGSSEDFSTGLNYILSQATYDIYLKITNSVDTICINANRNYIVDLTDPQITLDPLISASPSDYIRSYLVKGLVSDNSGVPTLSFHKNNTCTDLASFSGSQASYNAAGVTLNSSILDNLTMTPVYAKVVDAAGNSVCQLLISFTHIIGPATDSPTSYFTMEKNLITPKLPVQTNNIKFFARDVNSNPVSGLSPVLVITPDLSAPITCNMTTTANPGEYLCVASVGENYAVDISSGSITFMTNRHVGDVVVTDNSYCYQNSGLAWTNHKQTGGGSNATPYLICSAAQLKSLAESTTSADFSQEYKLMIDLDLASFLSTSTNEFSIGSGATAFSGVFDGNSLKIKNFKAKNNTQGFIHSMTAGSVKNLDFSYVSGTIASATTMSPFIGSINTSANVTINNVKVTGEIACNVANLCSVGGVIGSAIATGSGQINMTKINSLITASNISGSIGGVINSVSSPTASKVVLSEINSMLTMTHSNSGTITRIGGVVGSSIGMTIRNVKSNMSLNVSTALSQRVGGIVGSADSTIVENAFVIGNASIFDVNGIAGIFGRVTNFSSLTDSVSLMNISTHDCLITCGKVVGIKGSLDNSFFDTYTSNQTTFTFSSSAGTDVVETSINLVAQPGYFYNSLNTPMDAWDFTTIWETVPSNFPELIFVNN